MILMGVVFSYLLLKIYCLKTLVIEKSINEYVVSIIINPKNKYIQ